jgi:hypothetical protein
VHSTNRYLIDLSASDSVILLFGSVVVGRYERLKMMDLHLNG